MDNSNLEDLTIEQLQQILKILDKEKNPQQAKKISAVLFTKLQQRNLVSQAENNSIMHKIKRPFKHQLPYWSHLITAGLLFALALHIHFSDNIPILNISLALEGAEFTKLALTLSIVGSGVLSLFYFFREYFAQKKKK